MNYACELVIMINIQILKNCYSKVTLPLYNIIHTLAIEMCKAKKPGCAISQEIMNDIFKLRGNTHYHLAIHIVFNGSESASYMGHKTWEQ